MRHRRLFWTERSKIFLADPRRPFQLATFKAQTGRLGENLNAHRQNVRLHL
jgi:hypothetical protein